MSPEELLSLLADRPMCCAGLRKAATEEIERLRARVGRLESAMTTAEMRLSLWGALNPRAETAVAVLSAADLLHSARKGA